MRTCVDNPDLISIRLATRTGAHIGTYAQCDEHAIMPNMGGANSDYEGFNEADLAHQIASLITQLTGRVWNTAANERLATWLVDSGNRSTAVRWLVYVGEGNNPPMDPTEEFALRKPMEEALTGDRDAEPAGFLRRERRWWLPRR